MNRVGLREKANQRCGLICSLPDKKLISFGSWGLQFFKLDEIDTLMDNEPRAVSSLQVNNVATVFEIPNFMSVDC